MSTDLHSIDLKVYGYGVAWIPRGHTTWTMELEYDYLNLPAHYATLAAAAAARAGIAPTNLFSIQSLKLRHRLAGTRRLWRDLAPGTAQRL